MQGQHKIDHYFEFPMVEIGSNGNAVHKRVRQGTFPKNSIVIQMSWEDERGQCIYKTTAYNFLFCFITKELLYVKNNSPKYDLIITSTLGVLCMLDGDK
jgi:hypothetical protein